jgi:hypothetical protein
MEASDQPHVPASLIPGKDLPGPFCRKLGGPQSWSGRCGEEKHIEPTGNRTLARRYTDWATPDPYSHAGTEESHVEPQDSVLAEVWTNNPLNARVWRHIETNLIGETSGLWLRVVWYVM